MRPPDDGPSIAVKVTPEDLHHAAQQFSDTADDFAKLRENLRNGMRPTAGWAGVDDQARKFGQQFTDAYMKLEAGIERARGVLYDTSAKALTCQRSTTGWPTKPQSPAAHRASRPGPPPHRARSSPPRSPRSPSSATPPSATHHRSTRKSRPAIQRNCGPGHGPSTTPAMLSTR